MRNTLKGTLTEENLLKAFAGESQARNRYNFFASQASKEGYLGVEGVDADVIRRLLSPFAVGNSTGSERESITKLDFYEAGLTGKPDSATRRDALAKKMGLPAKMTSNALLAAINVLCDRSEFYDAVNQL